jgi:Mitochondrial carrier protein
MRLCAQVYANGGVRGFYRGFVAAIVQFAPTSAVWWSAYGVYKVSIRLGPFHESPYLPLVYAEFTATERRNMTPGSVQYSLCIYCVNVITALREL